LEHKPPALFPTAQTTLQPYSGLAALLQPQPRTLATFPLTQPHRAGQFQIELQAIVRLETDESKQLEGPFLSPEAKAIFQATRLLGQVIAEHPVESLLVGAGVAWLVYLATSRN